MVALQDVQSEEYSRELQAQQEAATAKQSLQLLSADKKLLSFGIAGGAASCSAAGHSIRGVQPGTAGSAGSRLSQ